MGGPLLARGMRHKRFLTVLALLLLGECAVAEEWPLIDRAGLVIRRELLPHSQDRTKKVELFWTQPVGDGPYPAVLLIHGHQEPVRNGGEALVRAGRLGSMASQGYVAASLSQPGYGHSDGPPDYCGPFTQEAVLGALEFLRQQPVVHAKKVALYGYSRGAIVASMVATRDPKLAAIILGAGAYDLASLYPTGHRRIDANIRREAGTSAEAFRARSAFYHADKLKVPVLLLHGARDERIPVWQAEAFAEKLKAHGVAVRLKIFPHAAHHIPMDEQYQEIYPFLAQSLH
jgi:dipeptidyl aminopeptidase/acylaminoacyl peptidase